MSDVNEARAEAASTEARSGARQLGVRAFVVGIGTLVSRISGLLREMIMAALYTRMETDAFFVAFRIPNGLRQILAERNARHALQCRQGRIPVGDAVDNDAALLGRRRVHE